MRTFHARIFQAAIDAGVPAQPVALKFTRNGVLDTAVAFRPRERFLPNFLRVLGEPATTCEIMFLEPVHAGTDGRRRMAETARSRIVAALGVSDRRRPGAVAEPQTDDLDPIAEEDAEA